MNSYKITWFDTNKRPQESEEIIQAETFNDAKAFAEYKLERDGMKNRRIYNLEPIESHNK